jgi:hypothetical protein
MSEMAAEWRDRRHFKPPIDGEQLIRLAQSSGRREPASRRSPEGLPTFALVRYD